MTAQRGAVAAVENEGAQAAAAVLSLGGNAADASIAGAFVQAVVDPMRCSIGGGAHVVYFDSRSGRAVVVDAGGVAPTGAAPGMYTLETQWENAYLVEGDLNRWGYRAQVVPGFVAGLGYLYEHYGSKRLTWRELVQPAISLAADGFAVHPHLYQAWRPQKHETSSLVGDGYAALAYSEESRRVFLREDGSVYGIGDIFRQPDLARTLETIADEGAESFYRGDIAERVAADFAEQQGLLTLEDFHAFAPVVEEPIEGSFRGFTVLTENAPSVGPTILQVLGILDGWDFESWGWNSPRYLHRLANAMFLALSERDDFAGDPRFVDVPVERLLAPQHIDSLRRLADDDAVARAPAGVAARGEETTHIAAIDADCNACGITHSVGVGTGVVTPGLGFMHNCHMVNFDPRPGVPNAIAPGKRGTQGGAPLLVLRDGMPAYSLGSPAGAFKVTALVQVLANASAFGMSLTEAVAADRIHVRTVPQAVVLEPRFDPRAAVALAQQGHEIVLDDYGARVAIVARDPSTGELDAASDPRGDRGAAMA